MTIESIIGLTPGIDLIKLLMVYVTHWRGKLECFNQKLQARTKHVPITRGVLKSYSL